MITKEPFLLSDEVKSALSSGRPVVALESTVIAHGLPRPQNLEVALRLQKIVLEAGATPATIAVLSGQLLVGLNNQQLKMLAEADDIQKISIRDLPLAVAQRWNGATTVAATIWIAHRAGIQVFATGGIGGVHRGALPDVSADLPQLAQTPIVAICSGAKIVLDLPATREWLETNGIPVVGYECDEMPAFYSRHSKLPVDARANSAAEVAAIVAAQRALGFQAALLVAVPVPHEVSVPLEVLENLLENALSEASSKGIVGRALTPFLLARLGERSAGATLRANIALLENNARIAAEVAQALQAQT